MPSVEDIPNEVLQEHLLPFLPLRDLFTLGATSRHFRALTVDPQLWAYKTRLTFSYTPSVASPSDGWHKRVYLGLLRPRSYVWGSTHHARLTSLADQPRPGVIRRVMSVDRPMEITAQFGKGRDWAAALGDTLRGEFADRGSAGVVELQAGGWSFTARDVDGGVWVWGQLDGQVIRFSAPSWEDRHCQCPDPTKIPLPCRAVSISAGRRHLLVLDADNLVWELTAWGRAYHHTSPALTAPSQSGSAGSAPHVAQLSAGWEHSAVLTSAGAVHVWFPFTGENVAALKPDDQLHGPLGVHDDDDARALRWGTVDGGVVYALDAVPRRPVLEEGRGDAEQQKHEREWAKMPQWRDEEDERVVKIASGLGWIVALKAKGEVWAIRVRPNSIGSWTYLPYFSSPATTHISAQYETLAAYTPTAAQSLRFTRVPSNFPDAGTWTPDTTVAAELQGQRVIQYVAGDYHSAALTADGALYTWGQNLHGQLGLGSPGQAGQNRDRPTRVDFGEDVFVFGITAAGWHTGALVLGDVEKPKGAETASEPHAPADSGETNDQDGTDMPGAFPQPRALTGTGLGMRGGLFRVGFAGRGAAPGARGGGPSSGLRTLPRSRPEQ